MDYGIRNGQMLHIKTRGPKFIAIKVSLLDWKSTELPKVSPLATVMDVKSMINKMKGIAVESQVLFFAGQQLND